MPGYKLSPNEEARLLQQEKDKRRKLRILQVREQAKENAHRLRQSVKSETNKQISKLASEIESDWQSQKREKLSRLEEIYTENLNNVGEAHRDASLKDEKLELAERAELKAEEKRRANKRHVSAIKKEVAQKKQADAEATKHIVARQYALEVERVRSSEVASRPPPPPDPIAALAPVKVKAVQFTDADAFSYTHFHSADNCFAEKATAEEQTGATGKPEEEQERIETWLVERNRSLHEQRIAARLRGLKAQEKECLKHDYKDMLHDLSDLQREDLHRRQQVVSTIPKQIFVPPHRRLEERYEEQKDMETAFENLYLKSTDYTADLSLALDPQPHPDMPSSEPSLDLSMQELEHNETVIPRSYQTIESPSTQPPDTLQPICVPNMSMYSAVTDTSASQVNAKQAPGVNLPQRNPGLKKLLNRIQAQRDDWIDRTQVNTTASQSEHLASETTESESATSLSQVTLTSSPKSPVQMPATRTQPRHESADMATFTDKNLLLHPMEEGAKLRQNMKESTDTSDVSAFLASERLKREKMKQENEVMKMEVQRKQFQLEEQKINLEKKIKEIEQRKRILEITKNLPTSDVLTSDPYNANNIPNPYIGMTNMQPAVDTTQLTGVSDLTQHTVDSTQLTRLSGLTQRTLDTTGVSGLTQRTVNTTQLTGLSSVTELTGDTTGVSGLTQMTLQSSPMSYVQQGIDIYQPVTHSQDLGTLLYNDIYKPLTY